MCWSADVSLKSFAVGMLFILIGIAYSVPLPLLFFCSTIVCMQLIEYIVWSNYTNKDINTKASLAAIALLFVQPIASILTLPSSSQRTVFLAAYIIASLVSVSVSRPAEYSMTRAENGHLAWNWLDENAEVSLVIYFVFLLTPLLFKKDFILLGISMITLLASLYTYHKENTWGSMWCWIVNGIVPLAIGSSILTKST
jgi:hypothetical protein